MVNKPYMKIFYSGEKIYADLSLSAIREEYGNFIDCKVEGKIDLNHDEYNPERKQYNASKLLSNMCKICGDSLFLLVIHEDIYCDTMNFVFGCAIPKRGAVLSTYRLDSAELIIKEVVHEVGHVMGLNHCNNECVMKFSNSIYEAMVKPSKLCPICRRTLLKVYGYV
ncbi:MAG TPA: peptidase [Thermoplasmatales archaeon]|nr:peptidase [Thermoplasmatales archaeon]